MTLKSMTTSCFLAAALATLPVSAAWHDHDTTRELMKEFESTANDAADQASAIQSSTLSSNVGWQVHAQKLQALKDDVNEMGRLLGRLDETRNSLTASDQAAIDGAAAILRELAGNTTAAVQYLNADQQNFWTPSYRRSISNLENASTQLASSLAHAIALDKTRAVH